MAVSFSITRTTTRFHDSNGNGVQDAGEQDFDFGEIGVYDPGDILYTRIKITNTGNDPATGVTVQDLTTGTTPVANPNDAADLSWINISPIASNDSFTAVANTVLRVGTANTINGGESVYFAGNLTSNDVGSLTGDDVAGFQIDAVANGVTTKGGTFNIFSDGTFNYVNDGADTDAELSAGDSFTYTIRDAGFDGTYNTADDLTSTATVTITFSTQSGVAGTAVNRVWYVDGAKNTDGTGTSADPFQSSQIASKLSGAGGAGDVDAAGHVIYVENTASGSIELEANQKLIGTGEDLNVGGFAIASDSGGNSALNATSGFAVTLSTGNTVAGINLGGTGGISGTSFGTLTVTDDVVLNTTGTALSLTTGAFAGTGFASTTSTGGLQNVLLSGVSGTVNLGSGALSGATGTAAAEGNLVVVGGSATVNYSGKIEQETADVAALNVRGAHTGTINLTGNITATEGLGLQFDNADGTYNLTGLVSLTGAGDAGIDILNGSNGTFTFGTASNLAVVTHNDGSDDAFVVTNSNANVTFNGTITDNNGNAVNIDGHDGGTITFQNGSINSTGSGIDVANSNGGAINFNSQITLNTGANTGIILINNNGSTTSFNPTGSGLDITTSSGSGFIATNGGTITIADSGTGNTINVTGAAGGASAFSATGGTAFGAAGVTFDSISQSGGTNAIILNGTGATGFFHVLGDSGSTNNSSGGTIQNTTGDGIELNNTRGVSIDQMTIQNTGGHGIDGTAVTNFAFTNGTINGAGDAAGENSINFVNLSGSAVSGIVTITNNAITNTEADGVNINNYSGNISYLNISNNTFTDGGALTTPGSAVVIGINALNAGTAASLTKADLNNNTITDFRAGAGFVVQANSDSTGTGFVSLGTAGNATNVINIMGNAMDGGNGGIGNQPDRFITAGVNGTGTGNFNISNNGTLAAPIKNIDGVVIELTSFGNANITSVIHNNYINANNAVAAAGIGVGHTTDSFSGTNDSGSLTTTITNNNVKGTDGQGILVVANGTGSIGTVNAHILNNTVAAPTTTSAARYGIQVSAGVSGSDVIVNLEISGNTSAGSTNTATGSKAPGIGIRKQGTDAEVNEFRIQGLSPSPATAAQMEAYVSSQNPGSASGTFGTGGTANVAGSNYKTTGAFMSAAAPAPSGDEPADEDLGATPAEQVPPAAPGESAPTVDGGAAAVPQAGNGTLPPAAGPVVVDDGVLSQAELDLVVDAAIQRWAAAGASEEQIAAMRAVKVSVADLGGLTLGQSNIGTIVLDSDAAGWNWFIDSTPGDDSEYAGSGSRLLAADKLGLAGTRIDLLTVLTHELGHQIGLSDINAPGSSDELMFGTIGAGERRLPGTEDLSHAGDSPVAGAFAFAPITLETIPAGQTVVVEYQQTINAPAEDGLVGSWTGQSIVDSTETLEELSNAESGNVDGLALGDRIFNDNNRNGLYDAGDSTFGGVVLTLYADTNNDGDYDEGVDLYVGYNEVNGVPGYQQGIDTPAAAGTGTALKATTNATGHYSFSSLAPGDYIVRVDASNFQAGGALFGRVSTPGVKNPNDTNADGDSNVAAPADVNVDNDDNGEQFLIGQAGTYAASRAIRLDYGQETVAGPTGTALDTNNSLDLAFFAPNAAPVIGAVTGDAQTYYENGAPIAIDLGGNATVTDGDSANFDGGSLTVSWNGSNGDRLTFGAGTSFDGNNDVFVGATKIGTLSTNANQIVITFNSNATPANVQTLLRAFQFDVNGNTPTAGVRTFTFTLVDGDGNDGGLGNDTGTATATITVVPVSDAPEGADRTGTGLYDSTGATYAFTVADFATGFADPNDSPANSFSGVKITTLPSASAGTIYYDSNLADATPGVAIAAGDIFTAQDLTDGKLTFVGAPGSAGTAMSFTFQVIDNGSIDNGGVVMDASPNTFSATIAAGNSAPVLDLDGDDSSTPSTVGGFKGSYTEGGAAAAIGDSDLSITDADSTDDIVSATVTITNPETGDKLNVGTLPASVTHDVANSTATMVKLTAAPNTSRADFEAALKAITFENSGDDPTDKGTNLSRSVTVVVNDGNTNSNTATATIAVTDVNDAPTGTSSTITAVEDAHRTLSAGDFGFADVDGVLGSVTISAVGGGGIYYDADGAGNASTPQLRTLPDTFTAQDLADGKVSFRADANSNGTAAATITFTVNDDDGAAAAASNVLTVNVTPVNDTPVLTTPGPVAATEQTAVQLLPAGSVSDADLDALNGGNGNYAGAQFSVNRNSAASTDDVFTLVAGPNFTIDGINLKTTGGQIFATISANNPGLIVINFTSSEAIATSALVDEVIQAVRYTNVSNTPPASVDLAVGFTDGSPNAVQGGGASGLDVNVVTVNIAAVNDLPTVTAADTTVTGTEDTNLVFKSTNGNAITVADADNASLTVTLTVANGILKLFQTTGLAVTGDGTGTVELTGSAANINAALEGLIYRGNLNHQGSDTLSIEVDDGTDVDTENVAITLSDDGTIDGDSGDNVLNGTPNHDVFILHQGGDDTANGLGGKDLFVFRAALTSQDKVDGGADRDQIAIQGDYTGARALTLGTGVVNVESFALIPGNNTNRGDPGTNTYSYHVTTVDENVAAGQVMTFDGAQLRAGENFTFRGAAETDGSFKVVGGLGTDDFVGGSGSDVFLFNDGAFGASDVVDGGAGTARDQLALRGNYNVLAFGAGQLVSIESLAILSGHDIPQDTAYNYTIIMNDNNLLGGSMTVDASQLRADETFNFFGQAESDGVFRISGGAGGDQILGGKLGDRIRGNGGNDNIYGQEGRDELYGGAGNDRFAYDSTTHSNAAATDKIMDFTTGDLIALDTIDANSITPGNDAFTFIGSAAFTLGTPGQLRAFQDPAQAGHWYVLGDVNGDAQADLVIEVYTTDLQPLDATDFSL